MGFGQTTLREIYISLVVFTWSCPGGGGVVRILFAEELSSQCPEFNIYNKPRLDPISHFPVIENSTGFSIFG